MRHLRYLIITAGAAALFFGAAAALTGPAWTAGRAPDKLQQARTTAAVRAFALHAARYQAGQDALDAVYRWSVRWRLSGPGRKADAAHLERMKALATKVKAKFDAGVASAADTAAASYYVAEAEVWAAGGR